MKLSVIVPVYNVRDYLRACVDSLLGQSLEDMEIILVDDGATDGSGDIADEYAAQYPERVKVLHTENGGQGRARNLGMEIARGEFLGFVDSDDWVDETMYEKLCRRAEETDADVVVCDFLEKYTDGREGYLPACVQQHWLAASGSSCNKIFRREIIGGVRFPHGLWYEDFYFSAMLLMKSRKTEYIAEPLYVYRRGQESTMHNNNAAKNLDMLKILDMLKPYMLEHGFEEEFRFFLINHVLLDSVNRLARQSAENKEQVIGELVSYVRENIPKLTECESFQKEARNRRIIMSLNYKGMHAMSRQILSVKQKLKS